MTIRIDFGNGRPVTLQGSPSAAEDFVTQLAETARVAGGVGAA